MKLPPPEAPAADLMLFIDRLEDACLDDPNRIAWDRNKQRWLDLYTGNHYATGNYSVSLADSGREPEEIARRPAPVIVKIIYNRVMNAVLAHLAAQVGNSPKVVFNARESGEPPIYYLNGYVQNPIVQQMAMQAGMNDPRAQELNNIYGQVPSEPQQMEDGTVVQGQQPHQATQEAAAQIGLSIPLQEPFVSQLKMMIDQGRMLSIQARQQGLPPPQNIVPPEALVEVTDQTTAQFTQTIFDALWEQCGGIEAVNENILNKKIIGWQATLFESDRTKIDQGDSPITLTNLDGALVFYDPMTSSFRPPRHSIMYEIVGLEEGIAKYPQFEELLRLKASEGTLGSRLSRRGRGGRLTNLRFGQDMCVIRTLWYRDWPYPMDPDEAVAQGHVRIGQVPDESAIQQQAAAPIVNPIGRGESLQADASELPQGSGGNQISPDGQTPNVNEPAQIPTRQAFLHAESGEEVTPNHPAWPVVYAIRECRDIEGEKVFDQRCRCPDIPLPSNINIPVPFSAYGIGEPDRLDGLQMAINRVLSDLVAWHRNKTYPIEIRHQAVADARGPALAKARLDPNTAVNVPGDLWSLVQGDLEKLVQYIGIPDMPNDGWKLLEFLVDAIDKESGNTEQNQGIAPSGTSGAWVANLQAASNQIMQVTSMSTEAWLKKLVRQFDYFISHEMTVQDIQKYTSKYPPPILQAFHDRKKQIYLDYGVEVQSGSAASKQAQIGSMMQARAQGIPISAPQIMRNMNLDPDDQLKQQGDFNQKMVETGAMDMAQQPQEQGKQEQPS